MPRRQTDGKLDTVGPGSIILAYASPEGIYQLVLCLITRILVDHNGQPGLLRPTGWNEPAAVGSDGHHPGSLGLPL